MHTTRLSSAGHIGWKSWQQAGTNCHASCTVLHGMAEAGGAALRWHRCTKQT